MNIGKLREAEALFLLQYPGGFASEELRQVVRRHNVGRLIEFAQTALAPEKFARRAQVLDDIVKIVSRSSMVSLFEKPRFRAFVEGLSRDDRARMAQAFERLLHGDQERGFTDLVELLAEAGLAKWSLVTVVPFYYRPEREVFVKPTTTKNVIRQYELEGLVYKPRPSWSFYAGYRDAIARMKAAVDPGLSPNNAAFTGFLMMTSAAGMPE
jgi:hypothetical protein